MPKAPSYPQEGFGRSSLKRFPYFLFAYFLARFPPELNYKRQIAHGMSQHKIVLVQGAPNLDKGSHFGDGSSVG